MGLKICMTYYEFTHRTRPDAGLKAVSNGLKGSQSAPKPSAPSTSASLRCHGTLGAERSRASHTVSQ